MYVDLLKSSCIAIHVVRVIELDQGAVLFIYAFTAIAASKEIKGSDIARRLWLIGAIISAMIFWIIIVIFEIFYIFFLIIVVIIIFFVVFFIVVSGAFILWIIIKITRLFVKFLQK